MSLHQHNIAWLKANEEQLKRAPRPEAIKTIRTQLGCGLREAFDFWETEPATWMQRLISQLDYMDKNQVSYYESPEEKIRVVLRTHYVKVATCSDVQAEQADALKKIGDILGYQPNR